MPESAKKGGGLAAPPSPFKIEDVKAIAREVPGVAAAAPVTYNTALAVYGNQNRSTPINGTDSSYFEVRDLVLGSGRKFSDNELRAGSQV